MPVTPRCNRGYLTQGPAGPDELVQVDWMNQDPSPDAHRTQLVLTNKSVDVIRRCPCQVGDLLDGQ